MPTGGKISNFLLEKSRIVALGEGERNFHVFYQITKAAGKTEQEQLGMMDPKYFYYLNQSREYSADGIDDVKEYADMRNAMNICGINSADQNSIMEIVAGILHVRADPLLLCIFLSSWETLIFMMMATIPSSMILLYSTFLLTYLYVMKFSLPSAIAGNQCRLAQGKTAQSPCYHGWIWQEVQRVSRSPECGTSEKQSRCIGEITLLSDV